jgi:transposase InsO family protein
VRAKHRARRLKQFITRYSADAYPAHPATARGTDDHAREKIAAWTHDYNTGRPHSSLGYATQAAFAADLKKQGAASLRIAGGYATQPLASPAHLGNNDAEALIATG